MPPGLGGLGGLHAARDGTQQPGGLGPKWAAMYAMFVAWKQGLENTGRSGVAAASERGVHVGCYISTTAILDHEAYVVLRCS